MDIFWNYTLCSLTHNAPCRPKPAVILASSARTPRFEPTSPRREFFVPYCSHCLQKGLTNQNPLTAHIFLGLRGAQTKELFIFRNWCPISIFVASWAARLNF